MGQPRALLRLELQGFFEDSGGVGHVGSVPSGEARGKQDHRGSGPAMAAETPAHTTEGRAMDAPHPMR